MHVCALHAPWFVAPFTSILLAGGLYWGSLLRADKAALAAQVSRSRRGGADAPTDAPVYTMTKYSAPIIFNELRDARLRYSTTCALIAGALLCMHPWCVMTYLDRVLYCLIPRLILSYTASYTVDRVLYCLIPRLIPRRIP